MTTHQKRRLDNNAIDMPIPKEIVNIIGEYARPKLWMYWIYDPCVATNTFEKSKFVEADTLENVCVYIFDTYISHLVRNRIILIDSETKYEIMRLNNLFQPCELCGGQYSSFCPNHYPTNENFLKYFNNVKNSDNIKVDIIRTVCSRWISNAQHTHDIMIKQVEW